MSNTHTFAASRQSAADPCAELLAEIEALWKSMQQKFQEMERIHKQWKLPGVTIKRTGDTVNITLPSGSRRTPPPRAGEGARTTIIGAQEARRFYQLWSDVNTMGRRRYELAQQFEDCRRRSTPRKPDPGQIQPPQPGVLPSPGPQPPPKKATLEFHGSREEIKEQVKELLKKAQEEVLIGQDDAFDKLLEITDAAGRATVKRMEKWTAQLLIEPTLENVEQVFQDLEIGMLVGADLADYGKEAFARAQQALRQAFTRQIQDAALRVRRQHSLENIRQLEEMVCAAVLVGVEPTLPVISQAIREMESAAKRLRGMP